jgi:ornithine cyclodeaminase
MTMADILILNRSEVEELLTLETIIPVIEKAFIAFADGRSKAFPVVRERLAEHRGIFGIKSGYLMDEDVIGLKAGGFWLDNPNRGLTAHQSTTVMFDPASGLPTALIDGNHITTIRTAAVGALAARVLARENARTAAVVGCGTQGTAQAEALCHVRPIKQIRAYDVSAENLRRFAESLRARGVTVQVCRNAEDAVRGADAVVTATPGNAPSVRNDWVGPGMHVSAFGSDTTGKVEMEAAIFQRATVVVDDVNQAITIGETQHAIAQGLIGREDIHATLGEILAGRKTGRTRDHEITLFDATGLAFQDLVAGHLAKRLAEERGMGRRVRLS